MSLVHASKVQEIAQAKNPKIAIINAVGDLSGVDVLYDLVLIGVFIRPEKTAGGILRPVDNLREDVYQGKVGLVLKFGEEIREPRIEAGDWVVFSIKDGWPITLNNTSCRLVPHEMIRMKVNDPNMVF